MSLYVAAYDVTDDDRRSRVARVLHRYGHRVQYSVFEVFVEPEELAILRRDLGFILEREDRFDLFPVDERPERHRISWQRAPDPWASVILL